MMALTKLEMLNMLSFENLKSHKKVLLRERKRHTARRVVSTPSVVLTGYPSPAGYPPVLTWPGGGVPPMSWPGWGGTLPQSPLAGYPPPSWTWQGTPLGVCPMEFWVMLQSIMGYGYPPPCVCPMAFCVMLHSIMGYGYPPVDRQTDMCQNITFPSYYVRGR